MSRTRFAVGLLSTVTFLALGTLLLSEGRTSVGALLLAIGAFRGAWLARERFHWDE